MLHVGLGHERTPNYSVGARTGRPAAALGKGFARTVARPARWGGNLTFSGQCLPFIPGPTLDCPRSRAGPTPGHGHRDAHRRLAQTTVARGSPLGGCAPTPEGAHE